MRRSWQVAYPEHEQQIDMNGHGVPHLTRRRKINLGVGFSFAKGAPKRLHAACGDESSRISNGHAIGEIWNAHQPRNGLKARLGW